MPPGSVRRSTGKPARLDRDGARGLARHAAAVHEADPPRELPGLGLEVHAGQRGELGAVGEEGQVLRPQAAFDVLRAPWSRPRRPAPCRPGAARAAPRAPAARRPATEEDEQRARPRRRRGASRRSLRAGARRRPREPSAPQPCPLHSRGVSACLGVLRRCWRRNCSISATRSPEGGSSSLISATSDGSIASAGAGASSSSSQLLRSSRRT